MTSENPYVHLTSQQLRRTHPVSGGATRKRAINRATVPVKPWTALLTVEIPNPTGGSSDVSSR